MEVYRKFKFDAAHFLPNVPEGHRCGKLHGHTFEVCVTVSGPVQPDSGWIMDFSHIKKLFGPVLDTLDHSCLNEIPGLENPTSENLVRWIWKRLKPSLPSLSMIELCETDSSGCRYDGTEDP